MASGRFLACLALLTVLFGAAVLVFRGPEDAPPVLPPKVEAPPPTTTLPEIPDAEAVEEEERLRAPLDEFDRAVRRWSWLVRQRERRFPPAKVDWEPEEKTPGRLAAAEHIGKGGRSILVFGPVDWGDVADPATGFPIRGVGCVATEEGDRFVADWNDEMRRFAAMNPEQPPGAALRSPDLISLSKAVRRLELAHLEDPADGVIIEVDPSGKSGRVDLGSRHELREGTIFAVWRPDDDLRQVDALVSVEALGPRSCRVRVVEDYETGRPLRVGASVSSPFFSLVRPPKVYLKPGRWLPDSARFKLRLEALGAAIGVRPDATIDVVVGESTYLRKSSHRDPLRPDVIRVSVSLAYVLLNL